MKDFEKDFIPYALAMRMKEIGFDEECLKYEYVSDKPSKESVLKDLSDKDYYGIPTFSQCFRWFRNNGLQGIPQEWTLNNFSYKIKSNREGAITIKVYGGYPLNFKTYEEAELACLERMIEIVELKNK